MAQPSDKNIMQHLFDPKVHQAHGRRAENDKLVEHIASNWQFGKDNSAHTASKVEEYV